MSDNVNHPAHYTQGGIECIDAMVSAFGAEAVRTYCKVNAFKYVWRADHKNGDEDIEKADWYLKKYLALKPEQPVKIETDKIPLAIAFENHEALMICEGEVEKEREKRESKRSDPDA